LFNYINNIWIKHIARVSQSILFLAEKYFTHNTFTIDSDNIKIYAICIMYKYKH